MSKATYVFVGHAAQIHDTPYEFKRFGQRAEMPVELAEKAIRGDLGAKIALLPAAIFDAHGFDPHHLKLYGDMGSHGQAPKDFIAKRDALWAQMRQPDPPSGAEDSDLA